MNHILKYIDVKLFKYGTQSFLAEISVVVVILAVVRCWLYSASACCGWSGKSWQAEYYGPTQEP